MCFCLITLIPSFFPCSTKHFRSCNLKIFFSCRAPIIKKKLSPENYREKCQDAQSLILTLNQIKLKHNICRNIACNMVRARLKCDAWRNFFSPVISQHAWRDKQAPLHRCIVQIDDKIMVVAFTIGTPRARFVQKSMRVKNTLPDSLQRCLTTGDHKPLTAINYTPLYFSVFIALMALLYFHLLQLVISQNRQINSTNSSPNSSF